MSKRNIVFIMADQLGASFLGCYGSKVPATPNLDALAEKGCQFDRYYAHCPVCAPNRATIFTGRSIEAHGMTTNNLHLSKEFPTFMHVLQDAGYYTGGFGKFHFSPMQQPLPKDFSFVGYDESVPTEDPRLGPWLDWVKREHPDQYELALSVAWPMNYVDQYGVDREDLRVSLENAREKYLKPKQDASSWHHMYCSPMPKEIHQTTWITDLGVDFIKRTSDRPFVCHLSYVDPHDPYDPPSPYDEMFDPDSIELPIPMAVKRYKTDILNNVLDFAGFSSIAKDTKALQKLRSLYYGKIKFIDDQIGRIIETLKEQGVLDSTVFVFTTDHGDMMGDHGFMTKGVKHYDSAVRCPLIISGSGIPQGEKIDHLCSSLDLFPTMTDLGGCPDIPPVEGHSLMPLLQGTALPAYDILVQSPYNSEGHVDTLFTAEGWRLSLYDDAQMQLFNLQDDPREQHDLSDDEAYGSLLRDLLVRLVLVKSQAGTIQNYGVLPRENGRAMQVLHDIAGPMTPTWTKKI
jgi:arylsulfatase A-like enzyme